MAGHERFRAHNRGDYGVFANSPAAQQANSQGKAKQPKGKGAKGSRTKKGAWGGETAGTDANVGDDDGRVVADPEGGAGAVRRGEPRAAAQQPHLPVHRHPCQPRVGSLQGTAIQQGLRSSAAAKPATSLTLIGADGAAVPLIRAPLLQLAMQLR